MFCVDEPTADAIRRAFYDDGEMSAVIEFRRHFPLITDNANARLCVRAVAGWRHVALPTNPAAGQRPRRRSSKGS